MVSLIPKKKRTWGVALNLRGLADAKQVAASAGVFILVLVFYAGLWVYGGVLASALTGLEADAKQLSSELDQEAEKNVRLFSLRIAQVGGLLDTHIHASDIFKLLEEVTHLRVQFTSFRFDDGLVTVTGLTDSYTSFGQQIIALEAHEEIRDLLVSDVLLNKNGQVSFRITFIVDRSVYQQYGS